MAENLPQKKVPLEPKKAQNEQGPMENKYLFFNVMPKVKADGQIKEATLKIHEDKPQTEAKKPSLISKYKKYLIIVGALIVIGIGVYFLVSKIGGGSYEEDSFLITNENINSEVKNEEEETGAGVEIQTSKEWQAKYFNNESCFEPTVCGDEADPDRDGLTNIEEFNLDIDPNNPDSDQDGLSDGDEINVFLSRPENAYTIENSEYEDSEYIIGAYKFIEGNVFLSEAEIEEITLKMESFNLHQPTIRTIGQILIDTYNFGVDEKEFEIQDNTLPEDLDQSAEAKQERDAQRSNLIKTISISLVKYYEDLSTFPETSDFEEMAEALQPYNKVATNIVDPINQSPYVYNYEPNETLTDFTLEFYSETQNQIIRLSFEDAQENKFKDEAALFDDRRKNDIKFIQTALLLYSTENIAGIELYVFPTEEAYKSLIVPNYISEVPKDPKTNQDYEYKVSENFNTFTLKVALDDPPTGTTGYLCNQEECRSY